MTTGKGHIISSINSFFLLWTPSDVNLSIFTEISSQLKVADISMELVLNGAGVGHKNSLVNSLEHSSGTCLAVTSSVQHLHSSVSPVCSSQLHSSLFPICSLLNKCYFSLLCPVWSLSITIYLFVLLKLEICIIFLTDWIIWSPLDTALFFNNNPINASCACL